MDVTGVVTKKNMNKNKINSKNLDYAVNDLNVIGSIYIEALNKIDQDIQFCEKILEKYPLNYSEYNCFGDNDQSYSLIYSGKKITCRMRATTNQSLTFKSLIELPVDLRLKLFNYLPSFINYIKEQLNAELLKFDSIQKDINNEIE